MKKIKSKIKRVGLTAALLLELFEGVVETASQFVPLTRTGMRRAASSWEIDSSRFDEALRALRRQGYLKKSEGEFLITPKGAARAKFLKAYQSVPRRGKWDGKWRLAVFDIPETRRTERNILRSILKRKGFYKLQNSVFISPFADLEDLNLLRHEFGIEKYVNFFLAKSASVDNDKQLREHFEL